MKQTKKEKKLKEVKLFTTNMRAWLRTHGIDHAGFGFGRLKSACAKQLGIYRGCVPKDREILAHIPMWGEPKTATVASPPPPAKKPARNDFYWSDEWRRLRYLALKKCGASCQCCGARPTPRHALHVDHVKPRSKFPELELELSNLQVLCEECNLGKGAWDQTDWR